MGNAQLFPKKMKNTIISHLWDVSLWSEIFSHLNNEHDLLRVAIVNNQFKSLLSLNYFWCKYVNDNYKHSKINIYESVLESANIIHRMTIFLNKNCDKTCDNNSVQCILSTTKLTNKCPNYQLSSNKHNIKKELIKGINENNYCECEIIYSNKTIMLYVTLNRYVLYDLESFWVNNKFLSDCDANKHLKFSNSLCDNNMQSKNYPLIRGNYIYGNNGMYLYVYNIFTFERKQIDIGIYDDIDYVFFYDDCLLTLKKYFA